MAGRQIPTVRVSIALVMLFLFAALIIGSFLQQTFTEKGIDPVSAKHSSALASFAIFGVLMWPILHRQRQQINMMLRQPDSWLTVILSAVALGLLMRLASWGSIIIPFSFGWTGLVPPGQGAGPYFWFECPPASKLLLILLVMSILTPAIEEIVHRGIIFGAIWPRGKTTAVLVSASLFALVHNFNTIPIAFFAGILLAIQYWHYKSLWASFTSHATFNSLLLVDHVCLQNIWQPESVTDSMIVLGWATTFLTLFAVGGAIWLSAFAPTGVSRAGPLRSQ